MPERLVQISRRDGEIKRVPRDDIPVVELLLQPDEYVCACELTEVDRYDYTRKTVDWRWMALIVTPL